MIIGLTGLSGSGKDTIANWLVENKGFERKAFADPLKKLLFEMNPSVRTREGTNRPLKEVILAEGNWERAKLVHPEVRRLLQTFATDFIRDKVDKDFWVKLTMYGLDSNVNYVFSDIRFSNEIEAIKQLGGTIIKVEFDRASLNKMDHVSENQVLDADFAVANAGSLIDLFEAVEKLLGGIVVDDD